VKPYSTTIKIFFTLCILLFGVNTVQAQDDSLALPYPQLLFGNPSNFQQNISYDVDAGEFSIQDRVGDHILLRPPMYMSARDFQEWMFNKQLQDYWKQKVQNPLADLGIGMKPKMQVGGEAFNRLFGGNTVDIRPQGSAELTFSGVANVNDNPSLSEQQRKQSNFKFDESIQMNVIGKIGTKLALRTNYDTQRTFDFENQMKLEYTGDEDQIVKKIELGNVSLPLNGSLITGTQSLFGIKAQFQFGKATFTAVFSEQKSETSSIRVDGGAQTSEFEFLADNYEANKHFFLSQYFYEYYDQALSQMPIVTSNVNINKIEVWVTNKISETNNVRNIASFMDLGENMQYVYNTGNVSPGTTNLFSPTNTNNSLEPGNLVSIFPNIRNINQVTSSMMGSGFEQAVDFEKIENARKLSASEFSLDSRLGFISLNQALNSDEVLAVAFQYTIDGVPYQVGEFSSDLASPDVLLLKLLKSTTTNVNLPLWHLMMKNVYSLGAYQLNQEDFDLQVYYQDDESGVPLPYIPESGISSQILIQLLNLDNLNNNNDPGANGYFDFLPNLTVNTSSGRVYFPATEPFGSYMRAKFYELGLSAELANKYVFEALYDSTKTAASQIAELNKYLIKGQYKSSSSSEIPLNAISIPQGSVSVTADGTPLEENIHFTVDYNLGRVKIIDEGLLNSGAQIDIQLENNSAYSMTTKSYMGLHADYKFSEDLLLGATVLRLSEKPQTQKVNIGDEPISNTIWGFDASYRTESQLLTTLIDKLPLIETKEKSNFTFTGEFAQFVPGHPKAINVDATGTAYVDDFENTQTPIDLRSAGAWYLASTPQDLTMFPEATLTNDLSYGYNRSLLSWYFIDPIFQRQSAYTPNHISESERKQHYVREISINEIFPDKDIPNGQPTRLRTFDLAYYPSERGPYNYDVEASENSAGINAEGELNAPEDRWAGIMRKVETNDFEAANIEFIEFWMMDPFLEDQEDLGGDFYINLGNISEDILKDSRKSFENGLSIDGSDDNIDTTAWGRVPSVQSLVNAFSSDPSARENQDVGLDGLDDDFERTFVPYNAPQTQSYLERISNLYGDGSQAFVVANNDPSGDNYHYYQGSDYDSQQKSILGRYMRYNGLDGNSPTSEQSPESYPTSATSLPNIEDINGDQTLSETEAFYQYKISLRPQDLQEVGQNYITSFIDNVGPNNNSRWIQFKVPIRSYDKKVGTIPDFKSIRFMRLFMKEFDNPVVLRFAALNLVRGEWRRYLYDLDNPGATEEDVVDFDISVVNLEENARREPINYVLPPGIDREQFFGSTTLQQQNEQSMVMRVCNLNNGEARAAYKNVTMDMRTYNRLKFFVHAEEKDPSMPLLDGDLTVFMRIGSDYTSNYYEYEVPLETTDWGDSDPEAIWPKANRFDIAFDDLQEAKSRRNKDIRNGVAGVAISDRASYLVNGKRVTVIGSPNVGNVKTIMIGVRNPELDSEFNPDDDGEVKCAEIWINELRLTDFDERGGWAAKAQMKARLADLGSVTLSGNMSTVGFGGLPQSVTERNKEETQQYNFTSNFDLGKLFPEEAKVKIPLFVGISEQIQNPQFNPMDPDIELEAALAAEDTDADRDTLRRVVQDYTKRRSINLTNIRKERGASAGARNSKSKGGDKSRSAGGRGGANKAKLYDIENFSLSYSFNEVFNRNINTEFSLMQEHDGGIGYNYNSSPKNYKPFNKVKFLKKSKYLRLIKDFNFYLLPKRLSARTDFHKSYTETKMRNIASLNSVNPINIVEPDTMFNKLFTLNQNYTLKYDLTRGIKMNFSSNSRSIIDEPEGRIDSETKRSALRDSILTFGRLTSYHHQYDIRYTVPINKFPITDWMSVSLNYDGTYDWTAGSQAVNNDSIKLGNTIQNTNKKRINAQLNMTSLYNKVPYFKKVNSSGSRGGRGSGSRGSKASKRGGKSEEKEKDKKDSKDGKDEESDEKEEEEEEKEYKFFEHLTRGLLALKNVTISYDETNGTMIPGFIPQVGVLGMSDAFNSSSAPGWGFIFGEQTTTAGLNQFAQNGWITKDSLLNQMFTQQYSSRMNLRATIEPIKKMRITMTAQRNESTNIAQYYRNVGEYDLPDFQTQNKNENGSFSMSFLAIKTSFRPMEIDRSQTFDEFLGMRLVMARRVAQANGVPFDANTSAYPEGFGSNSQEVLIPAFLAAYSGTDANSQTLSKFPKIPMPNWNMKYDGLTNIPWVAERFTKVSISHGYSCTYSVNSFQSNLLFDGLVDPFTGSNDPDDPFYIPDNFDVNGDYLTAQQIDNVNISEQFSPLIKVDITMKNSLTTRIEFSKDRSMVLSLNDNKITEQAGKSFTLGIGYRIDDFQFRVSTAKGNKTYSSNLDLNVDVTIRNNKSAIRKIEENSHQPIGGNTNISIKTTADYVLSDRVNLQLFYDRVVTKYEVANSYNQINSNFGVKLRFSFGS